MGEDSRLKKAGVRPGDRVIALNGQPIRADSDLEPLLGGGEIQLSIDRPRKVRPRTLKVPGRGAEMNELASLGFILLFALFAGHVGKLLRIPEVTGYIGAGIVVGPYVFGWISHDNLETLAVFSEVALGLILFSIRIRVRVWAHASDGWNDRCDHFD